MTTSPALRPQLTLDSLAAAMIADATANASAHRDTFRDMLAAFDLDLTTDMTIDEARDDDTQLIFADSDLLDSLLDDPRLRRMILDAYADLALLLFHD